MSYYLKGKNVYLSGPIHGVADDGKGWREMVSPILSADYGLNVVDPCKKSIAGEIGEDKKRFKNLIKEKNFKELKNEFYKIVRADLKMTDQSDFLIVYYSPSVHMFGTIHEMVVASNQKKPILVKYDKEQLDNINPWIFCLIKDNWAFDSWNDMFSYLNKINSGELDSSHWW